MACFKLTLAYDGTDFCGWQKQPEKRTVQGAVEEAWRQITGEEVRVMAASRTDSGVHAEGQVAGIETESRLSTDELVGALNAKLPPDVVVRAVETASDRFRPSHDATGKRYRYQVHNDRRPPVFDRHYVWHVPQPLDVEVMQRAGQALFGTHDFASFQSAGSVRESTVRTIRAIEVRRDLNDPARVTIEVEGDAFLYNMVRIIAGTLVDVGRGSRAESWVGEALAACDRTAAGQTAPAQGLLLLYVEYGSP